MCVMKKRAAGAVQMNTQRKLKILRNREVGVIDS